MKILTVDNYSWNPLRLGRDEHALLTSQVLYFLTETGHVERIDLDKAEFYRTYEGPCPALVFLDAIHSYEDTKTDIEWAIEVGASVICGHDYHPDYPGVVRAVNEAGGPAQLRETLWVLNRNAV